MDIKECFQEGKKYTIFRLSEVLATTAKQEITVTGFDEEGNPIYKQGRERRERCLKLYTRHYASAPLKPFEGAIFEGWNQPITCDSDVKGKEEGGFIVSQFRGNACYNFAGDVASVKTWVDSFQLNPHFDKTRVVATGWDNHQEIAAYPELYQGGHAVIDRLLEKTMIP